MCSTITTTRKFFTVLVSIFKFGHQVDFIQWIAISMVFTGLIIELYGEYQSKLVLYQTSSCLDVCPLPCSWLVVLVRNIIFFQKCLWLGSSPDKFCPDNDTILWQVNQSWHMFLLQVPWKTWPQAWAQARPQARRRDQERSVTPAPVAFLEILFYCLARQCGNL